MSDFVHLHLHSQYSLLDGANRLDDVIAGAKAAGQPALALTDHGNLFGAIDFHDKARKAGIRPILGIEAYVAQGSHQSRDVARASSNHLVLLARNETGFRNLIQLSTRSFLEGFYYKPRIDHELLRRHSEGLIGLSACLKGEINERILGRREREAEERATLYREILGEENFYLELQDHGIPEQRAANEVLRGMSKRLGIPLVATNDCHYLRRDDAFAHDVLLCIGTQRVLSDPDRLRYASEEFYLKSASEMTELFPRDGEAVENTLRIAERCNVELISDSFHLPEFPVPPGETVDSFFERQARDGLDRRFEELRRRTPAALERNPPEIYRERLRYELEVIRGMGFAGYFLIVWDFIRHARENDIPVGPGRGSAAGSLVSYALRITDIDPLQYNLLFERFLNPDRVSMPDIDTDICQRRRGEVLQYVTEKYGRDRVSQIITFGTLAAKAVLRDVGRVMGLPYAKVDRIAKLLPDMEKSLGEAAKNVPALAAEVERDEDIRRIVDAGSRLEGLTRHASVHAAGVVITPRAMDELVPLYKTSRDEIVTQWDMKVVERLGLLKMDFLGLKTVTVVDDTLKLLRHQGRDLDLDAIPLDDPDVYRLFCEGRTNGIFQFESSGMKDLLRRAQPSKFEDLAAFNALYRPGALTVGMVEEFIQRKTGKRRVSYLLPEIRSILEETYGVIAYQEQVMQIAVTIAGFTMAEADVLRKAMGKKDAGAMDRQRAKFVAGGARKGFAQAKVEELWNQIAPFAGYGFNKSHSVAYAMLAYKTAYLKAHHEVEFMAAMLSSEMSAVDEIAKYVQECKELGIEVLPPSVNESVWAFSVEAGRIRIGLGAVRGVGEAAAEAILEARQRVGRFRSLPHLAAEVDLKAANRKAFECLVRAGALDCFAAPRAALEAQLDRVLEYAQARRSDEAAGQAGLFGALSSHEPQVDARAREWPEGDRLAFEKEALGFYLSGNPLYEHGETLARLGAATTADIREGLVDGVVTLGGIVTRLRRTKIKSGANTGKMMARFVIEDLHGALPAALFAEAMQRCGGALEDGAVVLLKGTLRGRESETELSVDDVTPLADAARRLVWSIELRLPPGLGTREVLRLRDALVENAGELPVTLTIEVPGFDVRFAAPERFRVRLAPDLAGILETILGPGSIVEHFGPVN
jgi:DNA polymerase-3 subunit alpha